MAVILPGSSGNLPISEDLMYKFYDNKAITPRVRAALKKKEDEAESDEESGSSSSSNSSSSSKFGPAVRVDITDSLVRANIVNKTPALKKETEAAEPKKGRYDVMAEIQKRLAAEEAAAKKEKDEKLQEIADKVAASESEEEET